MGETFLYEVHYTEGLKNKIVVQAGDSQGTLHYIMHINRLMCTRLSQTSVLMKRDSEIFA